VLDCLGNTASTLMITLATTFCASCIELEGQGQGGCDLACVDDIALDGICETCEEGVIVDNDYDDDSICNDDEVYGCWYPNACNYNEMATEDDLSCLFVEGICDTCEDGAIVDKDADDDGVCNADEIAGCTTNTACNYNAMATDDDESCLFVDDICETCEEGQIVDNDADDDGVCNDSDQCAGFDDTIDTDDDGTPDGCDDDLSIYNGLIPVEFSIHNIYPNPFNPVTNIIYGLPEHVNVQIIIYDLSGKRVVTLINEFQTSGYHSVSWNADNHPSGLYFVNMKSGNYVKTQKLMLVK